MALVLAAKKVVKIVAYGKASPSARLGAWRVSVLRDAYYRAFWTHAVGETKRPQPRKRPAASTTAVASFSAQSARRLTRAANLQQGAAATESPRMSDVGSSAEEPMVCTTLSAGGKWIRTIAPDAAKGSAGRCQSGRRHDKWNHLKVRSEIARIDLGALPRPFRSQRDRWFESTSLQGRARKPSVPPAISRALARDRHTRPERPFSGRRS